MSDVRSLEYSGMSLAIALAVPYLVPKEEQFTIPEAQLKVFLKNMHLYHSQIHFNDRKPWFGYQLSYLLFLLLMDAECMLCKSFYLMRSRIFS